jgi:hypothetical protein
MEAIHEFEQKNFSGDRGGRFEGLLHPPVCPGAGRGDIGQEAQSGSFAAG